MRTIVSGKVTLQDIADADLIAGIVPTSFITNGKSTPPASQLPTEVMPICPMLPDAGERQRDWTMCLHADALIVSGGNDHLVNCARKSKLLIYEV
jgi:hypothetical protein